MWIAIEATTLASAFLVGFYNKSTSVEAAWKYVILCSVGISFALFGILILSYAQTQIVVPGTKISLNWNDILLLANRMDPNLMKLAFIFIFVGFGTKAGLAPMHSWLPDAHSQSPTPVSALLSGVLLKCAFYGLIRTNIIVTKSVGVGYTNNIFLIFGLISLVVAAGFIVMQKDIKRLLAYSSLEHVGIISVGLGFGGWLGVFGALFHILNHAITKSLMFFTAGNIAMRYQTKQMPRIKGVVNTMPLTGGLLILGTLALGGTPLCGTFLSELSILMAGIQNRQFIPVILILVTLALIFAGLAYHLFHVAFGRADQDIKTGEAFKPQLISMVVLGILVILLGVYIPSGLRQFMEQCVQIMQGVR
jgi:hydrogenase-4 component F